MKARHKEARVSHAVGKPGRGSWWSCWRSWRSVREDGWESSLPCGRAVLRGLAEEEADLFQGLGEGVLARHRRARFSIGSAVGSGGSIELFPRALPRHFKGAFRSGLSSNERSLELA